MLRISWAYRVSNEIDLERTGKQPETLPTTRKAAYFGPSSKVNTTG